MYIRILTFVIIESHQHNNGQKIHFFDGAEIRDVFNKLIMFKISQVRFEQPLIEIEN